MCVCVCVCKCNVCECYSAVLVIRLTYTSTKTCIKTEWHDYGEYIYPLSISKLREGYALSKCFSLYDVNSIGAYASKTQCFGKQNSTYYQHFQAKTKLALLVYLEGQYM